MEGGIQTLRSSLGIGGGAARASGARTARGRRETLRLRSSTAAVLLTLVSLPGLAESPGAAATVVAVRFGTMQATDAGKPEFRESASAPSDAAFGVQVVPKDDKPYRLLIVINAPEPLEAVEGGLIADDSGDATVVATQALVYQGTVTRTFTLDPKDPRGVYRLDVYVDGVKVGSGSIELVDVVSL